MAQSLIDASSMVRASLFNAKPFMPDAYSAPTTEPALVPATRSIWILRASSPLITPICAKPRAAPPPSASATRSGRCGLSSGGGIVGVVAGAAGVAGAVATGVPSVLLPVVVQAASTAEAAASEKLRRARLGDEGFNEFSSNGTGNANGVASGRDQADGGTDGPADSRTVSRRMGAPVALPCAADPSPATARAHHKAKLHARGSTVTKRCRGSPRIPQSGARAQRLAVRTRAANTP